MGVNQRAQIRMSDDEVASCPRQSRVRVRSWDHRKLGMGAVPVAGSTARYR
jgi:hypothetical protein